MPRQREGWVTERRATTRVHREFMDALAECKARKAAGERVRLMLAGDESHVLVQCWGRLGQLALELDEQSEIGGRQ